MKDASECGENLRCGVVVAIHLLAITSPGPLQWPRTLKWPGENKEQANWSGRRERERSYR